MIKPKSNTLLLVFTRNPELGKVKTRLAKGIGEQAALDVYITLLKHTENVLRKINCDKRVSYSVRVRHNDLWDNVIYQKKAQTGANLGARMQNAFINAFNDDYEKVIIIGSDLYDLRPHHLEQAIEALNHNDVAIGPAKDGGYYLLGMKTLHESVFKNKDWGTNTVLRSTLNDLKGLKIKQLETLNDIDFAEDLRPYPAFKTYL